MQNRILILLVAYLFLGCAQQMNPQGGPVDEMPPSIKKSEPQNYSTNFSEIGFKLTFDEFVSLTNIKQEYLISPPVENDPDFKLKGKSLIVTFNDELKPNTTYNLNFGEGIKDFHEGNALDSNIYVFSTGEYLDSLKVFGTVKNASDLTAVEKVHIMLYESNEDSIPAKVRPYYYAKSKKDGRFSLNNLKEGQFQLFALEDKNLNSIYDLPNERIGFLIDPISTSTFDTNLIIHMFQEKFDNQFVSSKKELRYGKWQLTFNQKLKDLSLNFIDTNISDPWFLMEMNKTMDTVILWNSLAGSKELELKIEIRDDTLVLDTLKITFSALPSDEKLDEIKPKLSGSISTGSVPYFIPLEIRWSSPIIDFDTNAIQIIHDLDTTFVNMERTGPSSFKLDYSLEEDSKYKLILEDSTFQDYLGSFNDSLILDFRTKSSIEYATLNLQIKGLNEGAYYLELLTEDEKRVEKIEFNNETSFDFPNLNPGKYKIKLTYDSNGNGLWDTGTFIPRKLAEKVIYFSSELEIKEGWDKKIEWIIPN